MLPRFVSVGILFTLLLGASGWVKAAEAKSLRLLSDGWQFRQRVTAPNAPETEWRAAQVPGDVHLDLLRAKLIGDPFFRENESKLQWIETADWEYRTTFDADSALLNRHHVELIFEGLDAAAQVYLNGVPVLTADNMFRRWSLDTKSQLHAGKNELLVAFPSPLTAAEAVAKKDPWRAKIGIAEKTYVRKAAYEYGWDWGPRFVTSGIWRPVYLQSWDDARISDLHVRQRDITSGLARLSVEAEVASSIDALAELNLTFEFNGAPTSLVRPIQLHAGLNRVELPVDIANPHLWFPSGYGEQPMYRFIADLKVGGAAIDRRVVRTGLRSVVLRRDLDQWGRSFEFVINGIPVFAKGADVIPFDSFPNRVTTENYRRILGSAKEANMNMIRHWGGGYYESDEFYEICDELGIMVWQDFMFGNDWQPGTYPFKENVAKEAEDQLRRLRDHPSIVLWCGNNETESAFSWVTGMRKIDPAAQIQMWKDYLTVFNGILGEAVREFTPEVPYWPSSPSADFEETSDDFHSGDGHDWSVWHGGVPFSEYEKHFNRFVSEYGFQSFPELRTVEAFTAPEDRAGILTPVMLAHQKNNRGNGIIQEYLQKEYGTPKDFESFLYASQVLQAEGIKIGAEHLRRNRPRIMGSLYWQLNDCWPVASWSSIDYFGRWKALHYFAKRFYAPLLVSPHFENGMLAVYVVSDKTQTTLATLRVRVLTFTGQVLLEKTQPLTVKALSSEPYLQLPRLDLDTKVPDAADAIIVTDLTVEGRLVSRNRLFLLPSKELHVPSAQISHEIQRSGDTYLLKLRSPAFARGAYVSFGNLDTKLSDNFVDLLPNEPTEISIASSASQADLERELTVRTLVDAFKTDH